MKYTKNDDKILIGVMLIPQGCLSEIHTTSVSQHRGSRVIVHSLQELYKGKETLIPLHQDQKEPVAYTSGFQ